MVTSSSTSTVLKHLSDRYEILQPIGRAFGYQQLLAQDIQHKHAVIIKSLAIEENTPTGDICCFEREIQLLESLKHPTIPRYIDSFTVNATHEGQARKGLVLVQSHPGGHTLAQQVAAQVTYSEAEIKAIAKQLLQGLVYLHSKGLVHRDIKPDNIAVATRNLDFDAKANRASGQMFGSRFGQMFGQVPTSQVSWLNLGTVQYVQAQRNDALVGTYGYMPPEQVGGQATFASDLYSLGATLIYLITGRHLGELPHRPNNGSMPRGGLEVKFACSTARLSQPFQQWLNWLIEPYVGDRPGSAKQALAALNYLPLSMFQRQLVRPVQAQMLPVPILNGRRDQYQPFFTQIKSVKKLRSFELVVPPVGLKSAQIKEALPPLVMGGTLLMVALHLFSLLHFSPEMFSLARMVDGIASLAAASLGGIGCLYSFIFLKNALQLLNTFLFRQVHIQMEADVLLIAYKYWLRSPTYVVNTRRTDIYSICALPSSGADSSALCILTHRNRTRTPRDCYKLTVADGALSDRDLRWLTSLLNDWRHQSGSCPNP